MHAFVHDLMPPGILSGGLSYHGMSPIISLLADAGIIEPHAYHQTSTFEAAITFARAEGIIPAPEAGHAIRATIEEAMRAKESGESRAILFTMYGHRHFDMSAYAAYFSGK